MENQCLAISCTAVQQWDQTYGLKKALAEGTIFPELNRTFFMAPEDSNTTLPADADPHILFSQVCFALDDALLYLDMHPGDERAKEYYSELLKKKEELEKQARCGCDCAGHFDWDHRPLVWEGGHA